MDSGVNFAFALVFIGILLGAGAIALAALGTGVTGVASNTIANATNSIGNLSAQLPTVY